jgi:hypothetical protein
MRDELGQPSVEAFVLPELTVDSEKLCWPTFITTKQDDAIAPSLFFQKAALATAGRVNKTFDLLKQGIHVGWVGTPGIGKSMTVNSLLMRVLEDMKPGGWPRTLLLRMPPYLTAFTVEDDNTVSATSFECIEQVAAQRQTMAFNKEDTMLIWELSEMEIDPQAAVPCLAVVSSRKAISRLKTMAKAGMLCFLLDAMSRQESGCVFDLLWQVDRVGLQNVMRIYASGDEVLSDVDSFSTAKAMFLARGDKVGFVIRHLLAYKVQLQQCRGSTSAALAIADFSQLDVFNLPPNSKNFISPFLRPGVEIPEVSYSYSQAAPALFAANPELQNDPACFEFRFLSDFLATELASSIRGPDDIFHLKRLGLKYQVHEAMVKTFGLMKPNAVESKSGSDFRAAWTVFNDVGHKKKLDDKDRALDFPKIPLCSSKQFYDGPFPNMSASKIPSGVVFRSTHSAAVLGEFIVADHDARLIFYVQVSRVLFFHNVT